MQQRGGSMSKKIAVLISDEFEDSEFTSPAD
ncbi:protease, partial [Klebsiella pneumoniae]